MDNTQCKISQRFIPLLKGILLLHLSSFYFHSHTVSAQLPLPATEREIIGIFKYRYPSTIREIMCSNKNIPNDCVDKPKGRQSRKRRRLNSGKNRKRDLISKRRKCRCSKKPSEPKEKRDMQSDQSLFTRPKIKVCSGPECLTFPHGRRSFTAQENAIVSKSTFIEVIAGVWDLCGEFAGSVSCVVMSGDNFLDIFQEESVRVTSFKRFDTATQANVGQLEPDEDVSAETNNSEVLEKMENMSNEMSKLAENVYKMEDVLERSTNLLLQDSYKNEKIRRKFMNVLHRLENT